MKSHPAKPGSPKTDREAAGRHWPADALEQRKLSELIPYARNARKHTPEQVDLIARAIEAWGWTNPPLVDEAGMIIAGHGRVLAAKRLAARDPGRYELIPVVVARGWTEAQKRAYVIADNKIAERAGWDRDVLAFEFAELRGLDFDLTLTGFELDEDGTGESVDRLEVPKAAEFAWALVGVPIADMGRLQAIVDSAQQIEGAIVELCEDGKGE